METMEAPVGFENCDSSAVRAVSKRRIGSLPYCMALGCADIGEAKLGDGRRVLITWDATSTVISSSGSPTTRYSRRSGWVPQRENAS